ncbi:hypothetical protein Vadar_011897 [Vaccinium darrowii]|uniref:Uncharacterized protein n=1 Tax=Vaccinium darrowii TaxID=229202 RepID=A0ACB7X034_9ERIC|nr:hypothetical protein Vadar_011897 [Vaccinium darrowii]
MLPEARGKRCLETRGWLVTISESGDMNLLHPLTRVQVSLPPISTLKYYEDGDMFNNFVLIQKAVLSSSPSGSSKDDYVLMIIYGSLGFLGFCRGGDKAWTTIETHNGRFMDITYFNDQFYAVNARGMIYVCDVGGRNPTEACPVGGEIQYTVVPNYERRPYIVEFEGNLLVVIRDGYDLRFPYGEVEMNADDTVDESRIDYETREFRVFKMDVSNWRGTELHSLGDNVLFLGDNASISIKASSGLRPNCIYYTDDCWPSYVLFKRGGGKDMGIFNLEDGSRTPCYGGESLSPICPPLWDITYFNDQFYAVTTKGLIYVCDIGGLNPTEACLVGGEIQYTAAPNHERRPYMVEFEGLRPNCIYYTDDCWPSYVFFKRGGGKDMGIYNLKDGNWTPCDEGESLSPFCPLWVRPYFG